MMASLGIGEVTVFRKLRVAFFSTGDELKSVGTPAAGEIYDSNRYTLHGMLRACTAKRSTWESWPTSPRRSSARLQTPPKRGCGHHVRRGVGGRSRFREDAARQAGRGAVLEDRDEAGAAARVWPDRQRAFLRAARKSGVGDGDFLRVRAGCAPDPAGPARARRLPTFKVPLAAPIRKVPGRTEFQRAILARDETGADGAHDRRPGLWDPVLDVAGELLRRAGAETGNVAAGESVDVQLLEGLI